MVSSSSAARGVCLGRRTDSRINRHRYRWKQYQHRPEHNQQQLSYGRLAKHSDQRDRGHNRRHDSRQHGGTIHHYESKRNDKWNQSKRHELDSQTEQHRYEHHVRQLDSTGKR